MSGHPNRWLVKALSSCSLVLIWGVAHNSGTEGRPHLQMLLEVRAERGYRSHGGRASYHQYAISRQVWHKATKVVPKWKA